MDSRGVSRRAYFLSIFNTESDCSAGIPKLLEKPFTTLFGLALLMFLGWSLISDTPTQRMERACRPVNWMGNITVSLASLSEPSARDANKEFQSRSGNPPPPPPEKGTKPLSASVQDTFDGFNYGCQYALWRLFYEKEYLAEQERLAKEAQQRELENRKAGGKSERDVAQVSTKTPPPAQKLN